MAHDLRPNLDQFLLQRRKRPVTHRPWQDRLPQKIAQVVGQHEQLQPNLVVRKIVTGHPTAPWIPQIQTKDGCFGVQTNGFGFNINWASGRTVVLEACTDLANPAWSPVATNTLTDGSSYFNDPAWTNYTSRFYRVHSP
jgi:hypothetical protein